MISKYLNCKSTEFKDFERIVKLCGCKYERSTTVFDSDKIWVTVMGEEAKMKKFCKKWSCASDKENAASESKGFWGIVKSKISGR